MISHADGELLKKYLLLSQEQEQQQQSFILNQKPKSQKHAFSSSSFSVNVSFSTAQTSTGNFVIDSSGALAEFGWTIYPNAEFIAWAAQEQVRKWEESTNED